MIRDFNVPSASYNPRGLMLCFLWCQILARQVARYSDCCNVKGNNLGTQTGRPAQRRYR
jgi:hypothetical protein